MIKKKLIVRNFFARGQTGAKMMFARSQKNCARIIFLFIVIASEAKQSTILPSKNSLLLLLPGLKMTGYTGTCARRGSGGRGILFR